MAWLGKVSLGGFPDLAGAVTKLSESVKNIEKNFDSALGFEEKSESSEASGLWPSTDRKTLFDPVMAFMGHKGGDSAAQPMDKEESANESVDKAESFQHASSVEENDGVPTEGLPKSASLKTDLAEYENEMPQTREENSGSHTKESSPNVPGEPDKIQPDEVELERQPDSQTLPVEPDIPCIRNVETADPLEPLEMKDSPERVLGEDSHTEESIPADSDRAVLVENSASDLPGSLSQQVTETEEFTEEGFPTHDDALDNRQISVEPETSDLTSQDVIKDESGSEYFNNSLPDMLPHMASGSVSHDIESPLKQMETGSQANSFDTDNVEKPMSLGINISDTVDSGFKMEKLRMEMKMMETALQGAARQAQAKADEIARLMNENEQLKSKIEDLKRKSSEAESDTLREEYHQRVASLERKVYALTKERDTLRREQSRKSDAAALLKEKDEIICQVMAEGEELSKKQAAQEATIRKLRAQVREFEEEKQRLNSKIQVEETKVESMKRDKAATEKLLQETVEKSQADLAAQKEFYTNALNAAKEAEALAEARANNEARTELEHRLREAGEREAALVQALEELRQTLSRTEQQAVFREDMHRRDIDDLQKRYQASERRCEELITQVPESTRPLLRQIEAMQETTARRAEAWAGVERTLNARLQDAETKAAEAVERERSMNERLSQTLSRMAVLETQVSCLRAEQTQLTRTLEKERQRASENRQEYLVAQEAVATHEGRAKQLEEEFRDLRSKHRHELLEAMSHRELLEQELERERTARLELERTTRMETPEVAKHVPTTKYQNPYFENGNISIRKLSSAGSLSSMEESFFLQASLDSSDSVVSERRNHGETALPPYFINSMTPRAFEHLEATLRQKDGELASYISRLASLEAIRDSLSEELVKMTEQCEKLRAEVAVLPGLRAELEALRQRHTAALELMGERDEELEELRADIFDLKEMYREQIDLLVNKQCLHGSPTSRYHWEALAPGFPMVSIFRRTVAAVNRK